MESGEGRYQTRVPAITLPFPSRYEFFFFPLSDVTPELNTPKQCQSFEGIYFSEIPFADGTLIFGANTECINVLLRAIERHSVYFRFELGYRSHSGIIGEPIFYLKLAWARRKIRFK